MLNNTVTPKAMKKRAAKNMVNVVENAARIGKSTVKNAEIMMTGFLPILKKKKKS